MTSIRRELLAWLSGGLLVAIVVAAAATYVRAKEEANEIFDYQLQQMAASLTGVPLAPGAPPGSGAVAGGDTLLVQVWDRNGVRLYMSRPQDNLPQHARLGFNNVTADGADWRVFSALADGQVVQVAQPMRVRAELAASMALRTIVPLLAVVPFLGLLSGTRSRAACVRSTASRARWATGRRPSSRRSTSTACRRKCGPSSRR
jgi:hypothetical protein